MLAPPDLLANGSSSREDVILTQASTSTSSRSPQGPITAPSPQFIDNSAFTPHIGSESPYKTPTTPARSPHIQPPEFSPTVSSPQSYSPTLTSTTVTSSFVPPPPSPTPSQKGAYPVPEGYYSNAAAAYPTAAADWKSSKQYNMYCQDPYQQTYQDQHHQQVYPDPAVVRVYPDPALVDTPTNTKKLKPTPILVPTKPKSKGRRKKIIWAMVIITLILIGVVAYVVVSMKNDKEYNDSLSPDGRVQAPPIPPYKSEKGHCPSFFCHDYFFTTCKGACKKDTVYKQCKSKCNGEFFCEMRCEDGEKCFDDCRTNLRTCDSYC